MNRHRLVPVFVVFLAFAGSVSFGDDPDLNYDTTVASPAYPDKHPAVLIDCAHFNYYSPEGNYKRYKPFADLIVNDGYRVAPNRQKFSKAVLTPYPVLVIAGAMGGPQRNQPAAANSAFTPAECDAVRDWVTAGGSLLLVTDRHPFGIATRELARRFRVEMSNGLATDMLNSTAFKSYLLFSKENGLLGDHPITQGRSEAEQISQVVSFAGQSLKGPIGSVAFLKLSDTAVDGTIDGIEGRQAPAKGRAQGLAFTVGKGRVVVLGECSMITAEIISSNHKPIGMNVPGNDDRQLALNIMHWLSNLKASPAATPTPAAATVAARPTSVPSTPTIPKSATAPKAATAPRAPASPSTPGRVLSTADIAEESEASIALIKGKGSSGTGFLIRPGVLMTNAHVIEGEFISDLEVAFPSADDAKNGPFPAELLYEDAKRDLAILAVKVDLPALRIAPSYSFRKGEDITVIGNPGLGGEVVLENAISRGVMSTKATLNGQEFYQLGIAVNPGNSGGPVFDSTGQVIGVVTLKTSKQEALAFSVPVEDLHEAMDQQAKLPTAEVNRTRAYHRGSVAVQALGTCGAIYSIGIDLHRAAATAAGRSSPDVKAASKIIDDAIAGLEKEALPIVVPQVAKVRKDVGMAPSLREKISKFAFSFDHLKTAYLAKPTAVPKKDLLAMKATHKQLMTELYATFKVDLPAKLMGAFEDHPLPQTSIITNVAPRSQGSSLRQRVQDRKANSLRARRGR